MGGRRPALAARLRPRPGVRNRRPLAHLQRPERHRQDHLAVAITYRAIQNGFDAAFTTATALIDELSLASHRGETRDVVSRYTHSDVLVIDEVGYLSYGPNAANVLFQVVNDRYLHQRPMIFTTNKPLAAWGRVLHDPDLAEAILDRVLERGRHIELRGRSYRTRHAPLDLNPGPESPSERPARISGNHPPEFPEPAHDWRIHLPHSFSPNGSCGRPAPETQSRQDLFDLSGSVVVAGAGFEPATFGL